MPAQIRPALSVRRWHRIPSAVQRLHLSIRFFLYKLEQGLTKPVLDKSSHFAYTVCGKRQGREAVPLRSRFRERPVWCEAAAETGGSRPGAAALNVQ